MTEQSSLSHSEAKQSPPHDRLLWIVVAPSFWVIHFLACYLTVAIWCEKGNGNAGLGPVDTLVILYTALALCGIGITGWHSLRKHQYGSGVLPHDAGTAEDRRRFIGFASLLLAALSFVATLFTALAFVFVGSCD